MSVKLQDVAHRAGVSAKTVSRVINAEAHVRPALRDAVLRAVADLGYRPNVFARSLSSARSYLLAFLTDDAASGYAIAMQRGAAERCRRDGYHLVTETVDLADDGWRTSLDALASALSLDGAIVAPPLSQSAALLDRLDALMLPYVCVSPDRVTERRAGSIGVDEASAAYRVARHLIGLGHRRIGFVEGDPVHAATMARRAGFDRAMREVELPVLPQLVTRGDFSFRSGLAAGEALLAGDPVPTAIFASNDDMALGVSVAALKRGVPVPGKLAIAGFDDAPTACLAWPPITTARQPTGAMGAAAAALLIDPAYRKATDRAAFRQCLHVDLVVRASTSPDTAGAP